MPNVEPSFVLYALLLEPGGCLRAHITLFELVEPEEKKKGVSCKLCRSNPGWHLQSKANTVVDRPVLPGTTRFFMLCDENTHLYLTVLDMPPPVTTVRAAVEDAPEAEDCPFAPVLPWELHHLHGFRPHTCHRSCSSWCGYVERQTLEDVVKKQCGHQKSLGSAPGTSAR